MLALGIVSTGLKKKFLENTRRGVKTKKLLMAKTKKKSNFSFFKSTPVLFQYGFTAGPRSSVFFLKFSPHPLPAMASIFSLKALELS